MITTLAFFHFSTDYYQIRYKDTLTSQVQGDTILKSQQWKERAREPSKVDMVWGGSDYIVFYGSARSILSSCLASVRQLHSSGMSIFSKYSSLD